MEADDFNNLKGDIEKNGLIEPIVLHDGKILDGVNRNKVCKELGITPETEEFKGDSPLDYVISKNLARRHLTSSQKAAIAVEYLPKFEEEAKGRMSEGGKGSQKIDTLKKGRATEKAAKVFNTNRQHISDAKKMKEENPELFEEVKAGRKKLNHAVQEIKKEEKIKTIQKEAKLPDSKFDVLLADPAWQFSNSGLGGAAANHYPTMPTEEICKMGIPEITKENCVLFLWATNAMLEDALRVVKSWGFAYKTNMVWIKDKETYGKLGFYVMGKHELLLICTKGKMTPFAKELPVSVIEAAKSKHSKKPEIVYEIIEKLYSGTKKIELFSRQKREGWHSFGNQITE